MWIASKIAGETSVASSTRRNTRLFFKPISFSVASFSLSLADGIRVMLDRSLPASSKISFPSNPRFGQVTLNLKVAFPDHAPHPFPGLSDGSRRDQDQCIERIAEPVDQTPDPNAVGFTGGFGTGDTEIVVAASFLKNPLGPGVPLKAVFVFLSVVGPEHLHDPPEVPKLAQSSALGAIVFAEGNKLNRYVCGANWPNPTISFKAFCHNSMGNFKICQDSVKIFWRVFTNC